MIALDVPFIPDARYAAFLRENKDRLSSVHFGLYDPATPDARVKTISLPLSALADELAGLAGVRKYALINSRFHPGEYYEGGPGLRALAAKLEFLLEAGLIDGIVFADQYCIQALSDHFPSLASSLEAVPSVNAMIDRFERAASALRYLEFTRFKPPGKLILDRCLNRDAAGLSTTIARIREAYPGITIELLANEGCLYQCPFKPAHESHIALTSGAFARDKTFGLNVGRGCVRYYFNDPAQFFRSPFIRPEDGERYAPCADALKLCGRTRGPEVMTRIVSAYLDGEYHGNLLDLMDAMEGLSGRIHIPNHEIPDDFTDQINGCSRLCGSCGYCQGLAASLVRFLRIEPGLMPWTPGEPPSGE